VLSVVLAWVVLVGCPVVAWVKGWGEAGVWGTPRGGWGGGGLGGAPAYGWRSCRGGGGGWLRQGKGSLETASLPFWAKTLWGLTNSKAKLLTQQKNTG